MVLLRCIIKSPNTTEQNEKVRLCILELANKFVSINAKICSMGDPSYPSMKWNDILTHVR